MEEAVEEVGEAGEGEDRAGEVEVTAERTKNN